MSSSLKKNKPFRTVQSYRLKDIVFIYPSWNYDNWVSWLLGTPTLPYNDNTARAYRSSCKDINEDDFIALSTHWFCSSSSRKRNERRRENTKMLTATMLWWGRVEPTGQWEAKMVVGYRSAECSKERLIARYLVSFNVLGDQYTYMNWLPWTWVFSKRNNSLYYSEKRFARFIIYAYAPLSI